MSNKFYQKYPLNSYVSLLPAQILCIVKNYRTKKLSAPINGGEYLLKIIATGEERWIKSRFVGNPKLIQE